jgi:broad specificity phosphatase PhoE
MIGYLVRYRNARGRITDPAKLNNVISNYRSTYLRLIMLRFSNFISIVNNQTFYDKICAGKPWRFILPLYDSTILTLSLAPKDRPVSLLMRHSERHPIITRDDVLTASLTTEGIKIAEEFGGKLSVVYTPGVMYASPVDRCIQTAAAISAGSGWKTAVSPDQRLSYPLMEQAWVDYVDNVDNGGEVPDAVKMLLDLVLGDQTANPARLNIYVTHDSVLGCLLAYLMNIEISPETWPNYLEGMALWRDGSSIYSLWRGEKTEVSGWLNGIKF